MRLPNLLKNGCESDYTEEEYDDFSNPLAETRAKTQRIWRSIGITPRQKTEFKESV